MKHEETFQDEALVNIFDQLQDIEELLNKTREKTSIHKMSPLLMDTEVLSNQQKV